MTTQLDDNSNQALGNLISDQIAESFQQRITFAEYMEMALYHPMHGYYASNAAVIGGKGDFFTSPHLGADFGELLAEQFVQMWEVLRRPNPFTLVEMGAGQGLLAVDLLRYLQRCHPEFLQSLDYIIVERASALIAEQQRQVKALKLIDTRLRWCSLDAIPADSITGCFFSNELVDAFPVHQVVMESGHLREVYVTANLDRNGNSHFSEVSGELSTADLTAYLDLVDINLSSDRYPDHYRTEINLTALDWMRTVADRLHRGYVLTIDYGYTSERYYSPARAQGTLQCYYQHAHHSNPYINVGQQDITAHIDFTALQRQGERCGLKPIGFTQQGLFLMALGLGDRIAALSHSTAASTEDIQAMLRRRDALHLLINPMALGNFGVLIQAKGLTHLKQSQSLKGLSLPPT